jgi:hypothetical protein
MPNFYLEKIKFLSAAHLIKARFHFKNYLKQTTMITATKIQ